MAANKIIGGSLIVAGTCVGASLLALPVATADGNFFTTLALFGVSWVIMSIAAFLLLEVCLWIKEDDTNLISMAKATLGVPGEVIAWVSFLLLLYVATAAYLAGGTDLATQTLVKLWHIDAHFALTIFGFSLGLQKLTAILLALVGGSFVYMGTFVVDQLNRVFMLGLFIAFTFLVYFLIPHVEASALTSYNPSYFNYPVAAIPVIIAAFAYQFVIPTLKTYLGGDVKRLSLIIIIGGLIPLVMNLLWQVMVQGAIPLTGEFGLKAIESQGDTVSGLAVAVSHISNKDGTVIFHARLFAACALVTSFLGVTLSLVDFLSDGLNVKKTHFGKFLLLVIAIVPPLFFAIFYPKGFVKALNYAGTFVSILLGILPALMIISGRYIKKINQNAPFTFPFGIAPVLLVLVTASCIIVANIYAQAQAAIS